MNSTKRERDSNYATLHLNENKIIKQPKKSSLPQLCPKLPVREITPTAAEEKVLKNDGNENRSIVSYIKQ